MAGLPVVIVLLGNKKGQKKLPLALEPALLGRTTWDEVNGGNFLPIFMCLKGHSSKTFKEKRRGSARC